MLAGASRSLPLMTKMQVASCGRSLWIYTLLIHSLQLWGGISASSLPAPKLVVRSRSSDSAVLVCQATDGHAGVLFKLYRFQEEVDSVTLPSDAEEVAFNVRLKEGPESELFCCFYKNQQGNLSRFSPYLKMEHHSGAPPTRSAPSYPAPVLSVEPPDGVVKRGDTLSFSCAVSARSLSTPSQRPVSFLLLWTAAGTESPSVIRQPRAIQVSGGGSQPGVFAVGPVKGGDDGQYTCLYQISRRDGVVNSTVSNMVKIIIKDLLPVPTLVLQQQTQVWHLICKGSPAYPGAFFSLYLGGEKFPIASQRSGVIGHEATFQMPVQDSVVAMYRCQYSVHLGGEWSSSEHSPSLAVSRGSPPPSTPGVDWPLVLGSFSAAALLLGTLALVAMLACRRVKAAAKEKKKREEAQFWTRVNAKDHVVDLTVSCSSFTSQDWANSGMPTEVASRSPLWNSHSTFTTPIH